MYSNLAVNKYLRLVGFLQPRIKMHGTTDTKHKLTFRTDLLVRSSKSKNRPLTTNLVPARSSQTDMYLPKYTASHTHTQGDSHCREKLKPQRTPAVELSSD